MRWLSSSSRFLCLLLCACDCNGGAAATKRVEQSTAATPPPPSANKRPVAAERLRTFFPDTLAGFTAPALAMPQTMPTPRGGTWTIMRRTYEQGPKTLIVEVSDVQLAVATRTLVEAQQGAKRSNGEQTFRGEAVGGYPALIQWTKSTKTAGVATLVNGRILVTVKVDPADNDEPAVAIASGLPFAKYAELALAQSAEEASGIAPKFDDKPAEEPASPAPPDPGAKPEAVKP